MKVYLVYCDGYDDVLKEEKASILYNFMARGKSGLEPEIPSGFPAYFIDCGAYNLQQETIGEIFIKSYSFWLKWVVERHPEIDAYANLDVIGNAEETLKNQKFLESEGLKPLPVWHAGESEEYLKSYCDKYEYVGIGGIISSHTSVQSQAKLWNWLFQKYKNTKFHFFGIGLAGSRIFRSARPYSVDCSSWLVPARYGRGCRLDKRGRIVSQTLDYQTRSDIRSDRDIRREEIRKVLRVLQGYSEEIDKVNDPYQGALL